MPKTTIISRKKLHGGLVAYPWRDRDGNFVLGDPKHGDVMHYRANAVLTDDYDEAVRLVRQGFSIRMTFGQGDPASLVSAKSLTIEEVEDVPEGAIPPKKAKAPITMAQVSEGVQRLLFAQAAVIELMAGEQTASAFLGVQWPLHRDLKGLVVEPGKFRTFQLAATAYDWAYQTGSPELFDNTRHAELAALVEAAPAGTQDFRSPLEDPGSDLSRVFGAALARWKLEFEPETKLVVRELAYLAGMGEAAARNALAKDKITSRSGVSAAIARKWLKKRNMFVATDPALKGRA